MITLPALTQEMIIVFSILGLVVVLLVFDLLRVDVVGLLVMTLLPLAGLLTGGEAVAGLGSNAVMVLISVMVIGSALDRTGVVSRIATMITSLAGTSEARVVSLLGVSVALPSGIMSNVGAVALMLPAALKISRLSGIPASRIIMPMGFCANMGGNLSLVGSTPLIILNDIMRDWWASTGPAGRGFEPLGLFSVTPIGLAMVFGALVYFLLIGPKLLPIREGRDEGGVVSARLRDLYGARVGQGFECVVPAGAGEMTLAGLDIRSRFNATVIGVAHDRGRKKVLAPGGDTRVTGGDVVLLTCRSENIARLSSELGWQRRDKIQTFSAELLPDKSGVIEGIVTSRSALNGHTMDELDLRGRYAVNPLAIMRGDRIYVRELVELPLKPGDALLLYGAWDALARLGEDADLIYTEELRASEVREDKAPLALFSLVLFLGLALGSDLALSVAGLAAVLLLVITRVLHIDEVYQAVEWKTIFLVAGLIPLGAAFDKTGAANFLAMAILSAMKSISGMQLYLVMAVMSSLFAMFISNVGTTVLLVPIAMTLAAKIGADPGIAALVVAVASINTFILPTHQVNALIMQPGGYSTSDYMRVGSGMMLLFLLILMGMLALFY